MTSGRRALAAAAATVLCAAAAISGLFRDLGDTVRVEVDDAVAGGVAAVPGLGETVAEAGFGSATVHVDAFRSGRLNTDGIG